MIQANLAGALLATGLCTALTAQAPLDTWPLPAAGARADYRTTMTMVQSHDRWSQPMRIELVIEESHTVRSVRDDGTRTVVVSVSRVHGSLEGGSFKKAVTFDSAAGKRMHPIAKGLVSEMLPERTVSVAATGEVHQVVKKVGERERTPTDHDRDIEQLYFVQPPTTPAAVGTRWRAPIGIHECTPSGCVELVTHNTLQAVSADTVTVETIATEEVEAGNEAAAEPQLQVKRSITLSRRDGLPLSMRASGGPPGKDLRMQMVRIPPGTATPDRAKDRP